MDSTQKTTKAERQGDTTPSTDEAESFALTVPPEFSGKTVREFLRDALPLEPLEFLRHMVQSENVTCDSKPCGRKRTLTAGETVVVRHLAREANAFKTPVVPAEVLYEDRDVLVLNKPAGCTVVRKRNTEHCAFQNGILAYLKCSPEAAAAAARERYRPRAVHRLDRDTTGVLVEAKTRAGELHLMQQFQDRTIKKEYLAVVHGEIADDTGTIDKPIGPVDDDISQMKIGGRYAKPSLTGYTVLERFRGLTLVDIRLHTGRRHQIRLHFGYIGHSIVADSLYGGGDGFLLSSVKRRYKVAKGREEKSLIARPALHAAAISFLPVGANDPVRVEAPLPHDMEVLLKMLRKHA